MADAAGASAMTKTPLVSVVMPSFNQAHFIGESISSVLDQDHDHLELIVSDGGSTDGTVDVLDAIGKKDPRLVWWSTTDRGPADAINKALAHSRGAIIGWLNSDDLYTDGAITRAVEQLTSGQNPVMCYGHGKHIDEIGGDLNAYPTRSPDVGIAAFAAGCFICQPTVFFKRTMYRLLGPLEESLKTSFDYDYWLRAFRAFSGRIAFIDEVQACSRLHGDCITMKMRRQVALEGLQTTAKHLGTGEKHWIATYLEDVRGQSEGDRGFDDFHAHAREVLEQARPHLSREAHLDLQAAFTNTIDSDAVQR